MPTHVVRRRPSMLALVLATAAVTFPIGVLASHQFGDVPNEQQFHTDIDAIADAGVTTGCGGGNYCPDANVTRGQMAAFMNRLGALQDGANPVVNADKVDGMDAGDFLAASGTAETRQFAPWLPYNGSSATIAYTPGTVTITSIAAQRHVIMPLTAPPDLGGVGFAFQSAEICYGSTVDVAIWETKIVEFQSVGVVGTTAVDTTDRTLNSNACYTITDNDPAAVPPGPLGLHLLLNFYDGATAPLGVVTVTWTALT